MTAKQVAAEKLHGRRGREWVLAETRVGRPPHFRLGPRTVLFDSEVIDAWIEAGTRKAERLVAS